MKHTPGPWVVAEEAKIKHPEGTFIAQAKYWPDAYLIAAAPELLEALQLLSNACEKMVGIGSQEPSPFLSKAGKEVFIANKYAKSVITKAKGA